VLYRDGAPGVEADGRMAIFWYEKAIEAGDIGGYSSLGSLYRHGAPGVEKNIETAKSWYRKGVAAGDYMSKVRLEEIE
jgi:TPR repeat protein